MRKVIFFIHVLFLIFTAGNSQAVDIYQADKLFAEKKYAEAFAEYQQSAEIGNSHAHFRLGGMYAKGLGTIKDNLKSLLHFYLAAELKHQKAQTVFANIVQGYNKDQRLNVIKLLEQKANNFDIEYVYKRYFPEYLPEKAKTIALPVTHMRRDAGKFGAAAIHHADVYPDGSFRNQYIWLDFKDSKIKLHNNLKRMNKQVLLNKKVFADQAPRFLQYHWRRSYGGLGKTEIEAMYRYLSQLKSSHKTQHREFMLAIFSITQAWMHSNKNYVDVFNESLSRLTKLSEQQYPPAMYLLGVNSFGVKSCYKGEVHCYTVKSNKVALNYIAEAARYNYPPAEFRLGMILKHSPYVKNDERKALFWFLSAAEKNFQPAVLRAAELLLTAQDESMRDTNKALELMDKYKHKNSPEYRFLLALTFKDQEQPNWRKFFDNLLKAIFEGTRRGYDVSEWQALYDKYIGGKITIQEDT